MLVVCADRATPRLFRKQSVKSAVVRHGRIRVAPADYVDLNIGHRAARFSQGSVYLTRKYWTAAEKKKRENKGHGLHGILLRLALHLSFKFGLRAGCKLLETPLIVQ